MTTNEVDQKAAAQETTSVAERHGPQFIPKLKGKKVIIRFSSGGQPITGTIEGYNPTRSSSRLQKGRSWSLSTRLLQSRSWMNQKDTGQIFSSRRYLQRSDQDRVLWTLTDRGGSMSKSDLARRVQMRLSEIDVVLQELEQARKIKLSEQRENWL